MNIILVALSPERISPEIRGRIAALAPDKRLMISTVRKEIESVLDSIEISTGGLPRDLIRKAPRLRWHHDFLGGTDWILQYPDLIERDLILTNSSGVHVNQASEHIAAFLLSFSRWFHGAGRAQMRSRWEKPECSAVFELAGKTVLLLGVGAIGSRFAKIAAALGMKIIGVRRRPERGKPPCVEKMIGPGKMRDHLSEADFFVVTAPFTPETEGMIGAEELRAMKSTAFLISIGRGKLIREGALIKALEEGWIAGAGLDVFEHEPLPESSPFWAMENVIITAHYAGRSPHYTDRALALFLDNLDRYEKGKPLRNVVDKRLGY